MPKKSALANTEITISGITMSGEEFEKRSEAAIKKLNGTEPAIINRSLRYDFSAVEIHDFSLQLATEIRKVAAIEEEKKSVTSDFSAKINSSKATCNKLSNFITNGYEYRDVQCTVEYHKPEHGKKTITRKDNNQSFVEKMEAYEWNLFNQVTEEEKDLLDE